MRNSRLSTSIFGEVLGWDVKQVEVRVNPDGNTQERMYIDPAAMPGVDNPHPYILDSKLGKFLFLKSVQPIVQLANNGLLISWNINSDGIISRKSDSGRQLGNKTDLVSGTFVGSDDAAQKRFLPLLGAIKRNI